MVLLRLVALAVLVYAAQAARVLREHNFKQLPLIASYEDLCNQVCNDTDTKKISYPGVCNFYIDCGKNEINIIKCGSGLLFNERIETCDWPYNVEAARCRGNGHPCPTRTTNRKLPGAQCNQVTTCSMVPGYATLQETNCPDGEGFDPDLGDCSPSAPCLKNLQRFPKWEEVDYFCVPLVNAPTKYNVTILTLLIDDVPSEPPKEPITRECASGLVYAGDDSCNCTRKEDQPLKCDFHEMVHLSSDDDSWALAAQNSEGYTKLTGEPQIEQSGSRAGWAYIEDQKISVPALQNNELGFVWNLTFTFQAGRKPNMELGLEMTGEQVALIDNSACDLEATYGCRLLLRSPTRGVVRCYANNHTVESNELSITSPVTVTLERNYVLGNMDVTVAGSGTVSYPFQFETGERMQVNRCPLTIGRGTDQRDYSGYMDGISLFKRACH